MRTLKVPPCHSPLFTNQPPLPSWSRNVLARSHVALRVMRGNGHAGCAGQPVRSCFAAPGSILSGAEFDLAPGDLPGTYVSYMSDRTGATGTWGATGAGAGAIIAVIDTATHEYPRLAGRVTADPDVSFDAGTPFEGSTAPTNHYHGTFVAGATASNCAMVMSPGDPLLEAILEHSPDSAI